MTLLYIDVADLIPFDVDDLLDISKIEIIENSPVEDNFVHKQNFTADILNPKFIEFLKSKNLEIQKVTVWHWFCHKPHWAHIDCNSDGEILPAALNWTVNNKKSQVNFYNMPDIDKTVRHGNEIDTGWRTDNVTAYIPIEVKGIDPDAVWDGRGPALINTSMPHLIVAPEMRTSISIGVMPPVPTINEMLERLRS